MVNYKQKYLEMKLKYIYAKQKMVAGGDPSETPVSISSTSNTTTTQPPPQVIPLTRSTRNDPHYFTNCDVRLSRKDMIYIRNDNPRCKNCLVDMTGQNVGQFVRPEAETDSDDDLDVGAAPPPVDASSDSD